MPPAFPRAVWLLLAFLTLVPSVLLRAQDAVRLYGVDYIDAREFGRRFGLTARWTEPAAVMRLESRWTRLELTLHRADTLLNDLRIYLGEPIVAYRGSLYLAKRDADHVLAPILSPPRTAVPRLKTILIDAGHGGRDPGNRNPRLRLQEKNLTLDVARRLGSLLAARGFRVVQTRRTDRYLELDDRTALIRRTRADLFISIHFNAFADPAVAGTETYVLTPLGDASSPAPERDGRMQATEYPGNRHDPWNVLLGYQVHRRLVEQLGCTDRGLKRFRYAVLRTATCPAVLVEAAFLTHGAEARLAATAGFRQKIAHALANGISAYAAALQRASG